MGLCLVLRLAFFLLVAPWRPAVERDAILRLDALEYHQLAMTLVSTGRLARGPDAPPETLRTPGYPTIVAGVYRVLGPHPWPVLLAQGLLDTVSCLLLMLVVRRLLGAAAALGAGIFYALDPLLILYSSTLLSDTVFVFCLVACFLLFIHGVAAGQRGRGGWWLAGCGLMLGAAALVKPAAQYAAVVFLGWFLCRAVRQPRAAARHSAVWLMAFLLPLAPWLARNYAVFGRAALSTSGSYNLLIMHVRAMVQAQRGQPSRTVQNRLKRQARALMAAEGKRPAERTPFQRADAYRRLALRYISRHPARYATATLRGVVHLFASPGTTPTARLLGLRWQKVDIKEHSSLLGMARAFLRSRGPAGLALAGAGLLFLLAAYLALVVGLVVAWRAGHRSLLIFCVAMTVYFAVLGGPGGLARFKLPALPFYLPFVGVGAGTVWRRLCSRPVPPARP